MKSKHIETLSVHAGQSPDPVNGARAVPLYRTTAYCFKDSAHAAGLFDLSIPGHLYTRLSNPTQEVLEERVAMMEGGAGAVAIASGTSAIFYALINLARQGDEIIASSNLYGGTYVMFDNILPQFGIKTRFVHSGDYEAFEKAINEKTRAIFVETIGNPTLEVADIQRMADLAHKHGLPLIVDSTFTTPALLKPMEYGADIVVHSLTKWMGGHGTAMGGILVDANKFDWKNPRFALYNEPDDSYGGIRWGHDLGAGSAFLARLRTVPLRNLGACLSPDNCWMILQGIETLALRMERHSENALKVAKYLKNHPKVAWLSYPGLETDQYYELAQRYLSKGAGGMVVFGLKGKSEGGAKKEGQSFIEALKMFSHVANVGDAKSLALHPASTTHSQLSNEQQLEAGLKPEMLRLSIGIEHIDDIIADLEQALSRA